MGWDGINWLVALGLSLLGTGLTYLWPAEREFGYGIFAIAVLALIVAVVGAILKWPPANALTTRLGKAKMVLLLGVLGTWLFLTFTLAVLAWTLLAQPIPGQVIGGPIAGTG